MLYMEIVCVSLFVEVWFMEFFWMGGLLRFVNREIFVGIVFVLVLMWDFSVSVMKLIDVGKVRE